MSECVIFYSLPGWVSTQGPKKFDSEEKAREFLKAEGCYNFSLVLGDTLKVITVESTYVLQEKEVTFD